MKNDIFKKKGDFFINVRERICYYEVVKNEVMIEEMKKLIGDEI